ncbi:hypothetical protein AN964_18250 [Heyndrickxia shackletonii]|uniref:Uncharacterized protein n=2 Tax=Heyndrickxia shackletonii TaxID=157838 RepID=A0A0Q3X097_9BACI|nr:hypothetical protein [Heyndrickxia shackletonii]KQL55261.1 hypothetical protein AN964_18250 [Heyndrickxia shackletonii]NEY98788.1 hypothetical protein [Heyndrickxia shackletonii]
MYENLILYEESTLAHSLYYLLAEKKISLDDDVSNIDMNRVNHEKIVQKNVLDIYKIGIYSLKMDQKTFIIIYNR